MSSVGSSESSSEPARWSLPTAGSLTRKSAGAAAISSTWVVSNSRPAASASSLTVSTSSRRTPAGEGRETLAAISVTSAPRRCAAAAKAIPTPAFYGTLRAADFTQYIKLITAGIGMLLLLLAWPAGREATGNTSLNFGNDAGEFFALMLLSLAGVLLVAGANDIMLLFLGIELASIPTYIMVSLSRPLPVAQEAGVKYFFLGAFAAAIMLFGFSYLYGTTGSTNLYEIMVRLHPPGASAGRITLSAWQSLAVCVLVAGFAFKMAAVPLHFYAGDVYQGAATPVTAASAMLAPDRRIAAV